MDETENTVKPPKSVWRIVKKTLIALFTTLLVLVVLAWAAAFLLEDKIKKKIVDEINAQVTVPVKVDGGISLSLLKHFPYASITFRKVSIDDKLRRNKKLLSVQEFSFLCNIFSLFGDKIEFSKIVAKTGALNMYRNEAGQANFDIFKPQAGDKGKAVAIQLTKAQVKDIQFTYIDKKQSANIDIAVQEITLNGNFNQSNFDLGARGSLQVKQLATGNESFLTGKTIKTDVTLQVDKAQQKYSFNKGDLTIDGSAFSITGFFAVGKTGTQLDFKLSNSGKDVRSLIALLPAKYKESLANAEGTGEYAITAEVKGLVQKNQVPKIKVGVDLTNSELKLGKYNKLFKNVNATAKYEADEWGNGRIVISNFSSTLNNLPFNFKLTLENFSNPAFDFYANGVLQVNELTPFIPDSVIQDIDGTIHFNNFHLKGKKSDFTDVENSSLTGGGQFTLKDVEFRQNGITYGNIGGVLKYEDAMIEAQGFTLNFLSTDISFSGSIGNLFPFIYNLSAKRKANNVVLQVNGNLKAQTFNLSGILEAYNKKNRPTAQVRQKINIREIFSMQGHLDIDIGKFVFRSMQFEHLKAGLQVAPGVIRINELSTFAMQGEVRTQGDVKFEADNSLHLLCDIRAIDLNLARIFKECENFSQNTLTDRHLKGTITAAINLDATWNNYKELDENSLNAIIDFKIKNGELVNFEPLLAASKFIRVEELKDIKFADLSNTIKISDRRIDIPEFEIKSTALNLVLFGHHNFDNTVDYHFKINLHKLLAQKFNRNTNTDAQYIEGDPYEGVNIYLSMTGNLADPKIKYDKAAGRNKAREDFKKEREEMRNLLKNNPVKKDENEQKREDKYFDVKEQPQFMDFEEEDK